MRAGIRVVFAVTLAPLALAAFTAAPASAGDPAAPGAGTAAVEGAAAEAAIAEIDGDPLPPPSCRLDFLSPSGTIVPTAGGCSATAHCEEGSDVSCSKSGSSGTCKFQDQDCSIGREGYVRCGGSQTNCKSCSGSGSCPSPCTSTSCNLTACCPSGFGECQSNGRCECLF